MQTSAKTDVRVSHYQNIVENYMDKVLSGEITTGTLERAAVERHVHDLEHAPSRGYRFVPEMGAYHCHLYPTLLKHSTGHFAGKPFELCDYQCFITWVLFGWRHERDILLRRFQFAYLEMARKQGKTAYTAGTMLCLDAADWPPEPRSEAYIAATKKDQALICFNEAKRMIARNPDLSELYKVYTGTYKIVNRSDDGIIQPISADSSTADGLNPTFTARDELHEWNPASRELTEKLHTGSDLRLNPLHISITTAGTDRSIVWQQEREAAVRTVLHPRSGVLVDDHKFAFICCLDDDDDIFLERTNKKVSSEGYRRFVQSPRFAKLMRKSNPGLNQTYPLEAAKAAAIEAFEDPLKRNQFKRYKCNIPVFDSERLIVPQDWANGSGPLDVEAGDYCQGAFDLGRTDDFASVALMFPKEVEIDGRTDVQYSFIVKAWCSSQTSVRISDEPFRTWIAEGHIEVCAGNQIDFSRVRDYCLEMAEKYDVAGWAYDGTFATETAQILEKEYQQCYEFFQTHKRYNEPTRNFLRLLKRGLIRHGNSPLLQWSAFNLMVSRNKNDEWMPDKAGSKDKIDPMVASLMALGASLWFDKTRFGYMDYEYGSLTGEIPSQVEGS